MRTTSCAARGRPLAALLFLTAVLTLSWTVAVAQSVYVNQTIEWSDEQETTRLGGEPSLADVTLHIEGLGPASGYPVDCVLIIDTSSTADLSTAKSFAFDLIDQFAGEDRIALVSYATTARLDVPLTRDRVKLKTAIGDLATGGKSALGVAMQMARRELLETGRGDAILVEVLLSDGQSNTGLEPSVEGEVAAETGIHIVSVGIGNLINRSLLEEFASRTEGLFYRYPSEEALLAIDERFDVDIAARDIRIDKRLPKGLNFVSASPKPSQVTTLSDGTTSLIWRISELVIGQELAIEMEIEAYETGAWSREAESLLTYADFRGVVGSIPIPTVNWPPMASFEYEPEDPTTSDMIEFADLSEDTNDDGEIVAWRWDFGDGDVSFEQSPRHRYPEQGAYEVRLTVIDDRGAASVAYASEVTVGNTLPFASFSTRGIDPIEAVDEDIMTADQPRVGVEILLDASGSYDLDNSIEWYMWDFDGDGVVDETTETSEITHAFSMPGEHRVVLIVVDEEGAQATVEKTINVIATVTTLRTIESGLPDGWTIPSGVVHVTLSLGMNTTVNGLSVTETVPAGWAFAAVESDGATMRESGLTIEWLFLEKFIPGGVDSGREIHYTLTAPDTVGEIEQATITGKLGSSSPRITQAISGDDRVTASSILSIPVVISRWDVLAGAIDPYLGETIAFDQIQYAVSLWVSGETVPNTGDMTITLKTMRDLIAYWLTGSSVHDPLP